MTTVYMVIFMAGWTTYGPINGMAQCQARALAMMHQANPDLGIVCQRQEPESR